MSIINAFNQNKIAFQLSESLRDFDAKKLGCSCKALNTKIREILKGRDENLEKIIKAFYTCRHVFNVEHFTNANMLFIGETHGNELCKDSQKELIHFLSKRGPVVVVLESLPRLEIFKKEQLEDVYRPISLISKRLDSSAPIYYVGWDDAESVQHIKDVGNSLETPFLEKQNILDKQADEIKNEIDQLIDELNNKSQLVRIQIEECATNSEIQDLEQVIESEDPYEYLEHFPKLLKINDNKKLEIENKINEIKEIKSKVDQKVIFYNSLLRELDKLESDFKEFLERKGYKAMGVVLSDTFPKRVQSMADTVSKIHDLIAKTLKLQHAKIVIVSGLSHLVRKVTNDENYNLDLFYKELAKHKAAILIPTYYNE